VYNEFIQKINNKKAEMNKEAKEELTEKLADMFAQLKKSG
jgi:hypothetical protein